MKSCLLFLAVLFSQTVRAEGLEPRHEIVVGVNPLVGYAGKATGGDVYTDLDGTFLASAAINYNYTLFSLLQFGVNTSFTRASLQSSSGTTTVTLIQLMGGPTLNIPFGSDWLYNSLFLALNGGILMTDSSSTSNNTEVAVSGDIGYRLRIVEHVTWHPALGAFKLLDGSKILFLARPLSFSFLF